MFPANISEEAMEGCEKLKTGTLLSSLGFLIIPAIIGFIYQIKGYFALATLNKLSTTDALESSELKVDLPKPEPVSNFERKINFCFIVFITFRVTGRENKLGRRRCKDV